MLTNLFPCFPNVDDVKHVGKNFENKCGGTGVEPVGIGTRRRAALGPLVHRGYGNTRRFLDDIPTPARVLSQKGNGDLARELPRCHVGCCARSKFCAVTVSCALARCAQNTPGSSSKFVWVGECFFSSSSASDFSSRIGGSTRAVLGEI